MSAVLDIVLVLVLLAYLATGWRLGFLRSLGGMAGVVAGAIAAALVAPWLGSFVPDDTGRVVATIVAAVVLVLIGHAIGAGIGAVIGGAVLKSPLGVVDRVLGAAAQVVVSALALSVIASLAVSLGVPYVAQPVAGSVVLRTIGDVTPAPVDRALAQLRSVVLNSGIPQLGTALGGSTGGSVPAAPDTAAVRQAEESVVKITGRAPACGQEQSGTGFVVARDRVLTNAHVLAGVTQPVVIARSGQALRGSVVRFDPTSDVALIAVDGLDAAPLRLGPTPEAGTVGAVAGYPYGGPFTTGGARVVRTGTVAVPDVGGGGRSSREIASLLADVRQGNSGGPLLAADGRVIGLVFARSGDDDELGYAMTRAEFAGTVERARSLTRAVSTGSCTRD
ncbi:MarP family serine protease [Amnibacterium endophyticum]|uniref:MarP family serine protease n=1 Tax=Amnibacterium endophyticum TaxID=2109337 RepID=A0ABW4LDW0_9MICO